MTADANSTTPSHDAHRQEVVAVVAIARNGVIGRDADVPWHLPADLRRVKRITMGHPLVMGRTTYDAIGHPLPGRTSVVLTRNPSWRPEGNPPGVYVAHSIDEALRIARGLPGGGTTIIFGGGHVYAAALDRCTRLDVTWVDADPPGDTYFPKIDPAVWVETSREPHDGYAFVTYERRRD